MDGCWVCRDNQPCIGQQDESITGSYGKSAWEDQESQKGKTTPTGKKLGRPRKETTAAVDGQPRGNRTTALEGLEAEIDRLLFQVMGIGDLTEIEDSLRRARRLLYGALTRG